MKITNIGNKEISIESPYSPEFVSKIKKAGAKWKTETKTWNMDERSIETARKIMREVYGQDDMPQELCNVRVRIGDRDITILHGPVVIFGRTIASAWGRDSGARLGDGICFEKGRANSGGSVKNWDTIVKAGSKIIIYDVPKMAVEDKISWDDDWGTFEILESTDPYESLKAEKEALLKRLAEIDDILKDAR